MNRLGFACPTKRKVGNPGCARLPSRLAFLAAEVAVVLEREVAVRPLVRCRLFVVGLAVVATNLALSAPAGAVTGAGGPTCQAYMVPVSIADGGPAAYRIFGQLCYAGTTPPSTVQLLVHGDTYNHLYWDFPYDNTYYSYVRYATAAGYATFNVDRLGSGASSKPDSTLVTVDAGVTALHDVISQLRSGAIGGHAFAHVIWVGHSYGSMFGWYEISKYHDVNAAIFSGALHAVNAPFLDSIGPDIEQANTDPKFQSLGLDDGYYTTVAGTRGDVFYYAPGADPNVIAADDANRDLGNTTQEQVGDPAFGLPPDQSPSQGVTVPVLVVNGEEDNLFCGPSPALDCTDPAAVQQHEQAYYPRQAHVQVVMLPKTGHAISLSYAAPVFDAIALEWAYEHVAP
jgi:pimeloyl-ACP methyl ester carboxylesterase